MRRRAASLTLLASFIPVVGTPLVWLPAVVLLWTFDDHVPAILLLTWCVVLVSGVEHVGKPLVLRRILHSREPMHTGLVFLSLLGGIQMFGLIGIVLGPLVIALFLAMVRMYERRIEPRPAAQQERRGRLPRSARSEHQRTVFPLSRSSTMKR